jgi:hypothetical protein
MRQRLSTIVPLFVKQKKANESSRFSRSGPEKSFSWNRHFHQRLGAEFPQRPFHPTQ